jgi:V/A-type H+-transporting ATPase subunit I
MDRVEIVLLRSELARLTPFLQEQGVVHLEDVPLALENHPGYLHRIHLDERQNIDLATLEEIRRLNREFLPLLPSPASHDAVVAAGPALALLPLEELHRLATSAHRTLRSLARRRLNAEDNATLIHRYWESLEAISPLLAVREVRLGANARAIMLHEFSDKDLAEFTGRVRTELGQECALYAEPVGKNRHIAVLTHPEGLLDAASAFLQAEGILAVDPPDSSISGHNIAEVLQKIQLRLAQLKDDLAALARELAEYNTREGARLIALDQLTASKLAQLTVTDQFAQSRMVAVVHGWVPTNAYKPLVAALKQQFGDRATAAKMSQDEVEITRIPTLLTNSRLLKPFELILDMFNPPKYGTVDPTRMVAFAFILFYGFILGDMGYALLILGLTTWMKKKYAHNEMASDALTIAQWMGASSFAWGFLYMEFFGNMPEKILGLHAILHRFEQPMLMLGIAVSYGAVHVPLGLVLGIREGYRHHDHHAEEKLGMLLGLIALAVFVATIAGLAPLGTVVGYAVASLLFVAGLGLLIKSMGGMFAVGVLEILGLTANVLSYARLMALGIASVVLADLANDLLYNSSGLVFLLLAVPMAGLIHLLNIGIGVFSPTIHSLRLNYVEFLPKFYEPEGRNYTPFRKGVAW